MCAPECAHFSPISAHTFHTVLPCGGILSCPLCPLFLTLGQEGVCVLGNRTPIVDMIERKGPRHRLATPRTRRRINRAGSTTDVSKMLKTAKYSDCKSVKGSFHDAKITGNSVLPTGPECSQTYCTCKPALVYSKWTQCLPCVFTHPICCNETINT